MPALKNREADMEIGFVQYGNKTKLYIQCGQDRKYYGTLQYEKRFKFLEMLEKWDAAGGNDGQP